MIIKKKKYLYSIIWFAISTYNFVCGEEEVGGLQELKEVTIKIHQNGDPNACGMTNNENFMSTLSLSIEYLKDNARFQSKYMFDMILTHVLSTSLISEDDETLAGVSNVCGPAITKNESKINGILSYCDAGTERTPKLPDHPKHIPIQPIDINTNEISTEQSYPCHFHTREGTRLVSFSNLVEYIQTQDLNCEEESNSCKSLNSKHEIHLYAVPVGRVFMYAPSYIGETFDVSTRMSSSVAPISLEVLSLEPRIFNIQNFFTTEEADAIIEDLLMETRESHQMKRSTTGSAASKSKHAQRTSESGFVTDTESAMIIKARAFSLLGFDEYDESFADGLQVLRYNETHAYRSHDDYFRGKFLNDDHDYDSEYVGTNRFATILLYMNDIKDGGELYFPNAAAQHQSIDPEISASQALNDIRENYPSLFDAGSWEEQLTVECRTKFVVKPHAAKAVLFYSQFPNGTMDTFARHGACPVLNGTKWAANIWVWNGPRNTYPGEPKISPDKIARSKQKKKKDSTEQKNGQVLARFENANLDPQFQNAELYYENQFWSKLGHGDVASVNTFQSHKWNLRVNNEIMKEWVMDTRAKQYYKV